LKRRQLDAKPHPAPPLKGNPTAKGKGKGDGNGDGDGKSTPEGKRKPAPQGDKKIEPHIQAVYGLPITCCLSPPGKIASLGQTSKWHLEKTPRSIDALLLKALQRLARPSLRRTEWEIFRGALNLA
jgi:hypothetical protein